MFGPNSLMTRMAVGKGIGFVIGLMAFFVLPMMVPDAPMHLRLGILLWYTTIGAFIGMAGVMNWHPILQLPLPWWVRAPFIGAWMNLVLVFIAFDTLQGVMMAAFGPEGAITSPYWFVLEGFIVGAVIGFFATKLGGEGPAIADTGRPESA